MRLLLLFFSLPFIVFSQNSLEKELFPSVNQLEKVSPTETKFVDTNGKVLGIRRVSDKDTLYLDRMHRKLKSIPVIVVAQVNTNTTNPTTPSAIANDTETEVVIGSVKDGKQPYIVRRRNRVIYFNGDGTKDMVVRQRRNGKKVTYRDGHRKLLGYKSRTAEGITTYYDNKRRKTGQSFLSANGKLVFEPYRNRVTPSFMFKEVFISY
jgi:hypothetical protein